MIKLLVTRFSALVWLCHIVTLVGTPATPYYSIRSQSVDSARELIGWADLVNMYRSDPCDRFGVFGVTFEYTRSFNPESIARCLFGDSCLQNCPCPTIKITGSEVEGRGQRDWLADYFGLATDFSSTITFEPRIENYLVDFDWYYALDRWLPGVYVRVHAPVVHTKWSLNYCEQVNNEGIDNYEEHYFTLHAVPRSVLLDSFSQYITECKAPRLIDGSLVGENNEASRSVVSVFEPLRASKWAHCCSRLTETRVSDIQIAVGKNLWQCDDYHFGLAVRASMPIGNRPQGDFLFEPIVGNGHHWEAGVGLTGHYTFWDDCESDESAGLYVDANITHLFSDKQYRTFDLTNGCNSRYMLAIKMGTPVEDLEAVLLPQTNIPAAQFQGVITPVANLTHVPVEVSIGVQADVTVLLNYQRCNTTFDCGYNFWSRSCEKIKFDECTNCPNPFVDNHTWALKGTALMFGVENVALSSTESQSTIHNGAFEIDNPAETGPGSDVTSYDPIFIRPNNVDLCGARTKGLSHKLFVHCNRFWCNEKRCYESYLGIGAKVEFGSNSCGPNQATVCSDPSCRSVEFCAGCKRCSLSEWGIWLKGGLAYW